MFRRFTLAALLVFVGAVGGMVLTGRFRLAEESIADTGRSSSVAAAPERSLAAQAGAAVSGPRDFADVTARAVGAVVNISSQTVTRSPFANDPFWQFFFGGDEGMMGARRSTSLGSGVVVSPDGYVVTNNHVIGESLRGNPEINVVLPDKRELRGKLVGTDPMTDIALVKINLRGLPVIPWADSSKLRVGQWVLAIGSPFQLNQTVTLGIISALSRRNVGLSEYEDFIQTDAAINPGNSGGALIDERGDLVGINTAILSETGGYQGIGFAVPSNLARRVVDELARNGYVRRGSIGMLQVAGLTTGDAEYLGLSDTHGAYVARMARSSAAYEAGIRPGDVIVGFNGARIEDPSQLLRLLADSKIGSTATVDIIRRGRRIELRVPITQGTD
jgi:Do/DeqQ family serine protease